MITSHGKYIIGKVIRCVGIHGDVRIKSISDNDGRFLDLKSLLIGQSEEDAKEFDIKKIKENNGFVTVRFDKLNTRTEVEPLVGSFVFIDEKDVPPPPQGKHYIHEMIGIKIISDDGLHEGVLKDVMNMPAQDIYVGDFNGREVLIPAVPEFIKNVDMNNRVITFVNIPGLFEENNEN